jgi:hypothetical protein
MKKRIKYEVWGKGAKLIPGETYAYYQVSDDDVYPLSIRECVENSIMRKTGLCVKSCHDGYEVDSRGKTLRAQYHATLAKFSMDGGFYVVDELWFSIPNVT